MLWLEMSRDETHGGGSWAFGKSLWSPPRKTNGARWAFWETLLSVEAGDLVLHLRGKDNNAAFVGFSTAAANGFETSDRPPNAGEWEFSQTFYRVPLQDFSPFADRIPLRSVFASSDIDLRNYFVRNKAATKKERLFYVIQGGRLQCLNGAYLSEVSNELASLLLSKPEYIPQSWPSVVREAKTGERVQELLTRVGQREFSDMVRENYGARCCFPDCDVEERAFLRGSHIARWADAPELRGKVTNGLCLCLMHDQAFEQGMFTVDLDMCIWVNPVKASQSLWAKTHLVPYQGRNLRSGKVPPLEEALIEHWERTSCYPA